MNVKELIAHLQTLDPTLRVFVQIDGREDEPAPLQGAPDLFQVWNFEEGEREEVPSAILLSGYYDMD